MKDKIEKKLNKYISYDTLNIIALIVVFFASVQLYLINK